MSGIKDTIRLGVLGATLVGGSYLVGRCSYETDLDDIKEYVKEDKAQALDVYNYSHSHLKEVHPEMLPRESNLESELKKESGFFEKMGDKLERAYDALTE